MSAADNADAARSLHRSALEAYRLGSPTQAAELISAAIARDGTVAAYPCNLGVMLAAIGQFSEAMAAYLQALALAPDLVDAHHNLGNVLQALGDHPAAIRSLKRAIILRLDTPEAHNSLGVALKAGGRTQQAVAWHRRALLLKPDYAGAHSNLGVALKALDRPLEASCRFRSALSLAPDYGAAFSNLAAALKEAGLAVPASVACRRALRLDPGDFRAHNNFGGALQQQSRPALAGDAFRRALSLQPDQLEAYTNLGGALMALGQPERALDVFERCLTLAPDNADARWNRGLCRLLLGELGPPAWEDYAWRWRLPATPTAPPAAALPAWRGEQGQGGTLLLWAEQGYGDSIQFVRYAAVARQLGWRVLLDVPPPLSRLFRSVAGATVAQSGTLLPRVSAQCALPDLPGALATRQGTIPSKVPYLSADPALAGEWRHRLAACCGLKIGLAWRGNPSHSNDRHRSLDAVALAQALALPGITLVSLQPDASTPELAALRLAAPMLDAGPALGDFADTAALIAGLDLVISVDSAVCHLAGALGHPVWTLLPFAPDWRWLRSRCDNPWYPTMRLFRQPRPGDWVSVYEALRLALSQLRDGISGAGKPLY
jgi:tetratricopeptide (TPR) repeat protein